MTMFPICNYTGPVNSWNISLNGFDPTAISFPAFYGCCNNIQEDHFVSDGGWTYIELVFKQIGLNNSVLSKFKRHLKSSKEYTGLPGSQATIKVGMYGGSFADKYISGIQSYINCSEGKNIVNGSQHYPSTKHAISTTDKVLSGVLGSFIAISGIVYLINRHRNDHYSPVSSNE